MAEPSVVAWGESPYEKRDGHELYLHSTSSLINV